MKLCKQCNKYPVWSHGYCVYHQYLAPKKKKKKTTLFVKKTKLDAEYKKKRANFLQLYPVCQANLINCTTISTEVHHRRGRGKYYLDESTWLSVCRICHNFIELNPIIAKQLGFSLSRLSNN